MYICMHLLCPSSAFPFLTLFFALRMTFLASHGQRRLLEVLAQPHGSWILIIVRLASQRWSAPNRLGPAPSRRVLP